MATRNPARAALIIPALNEAESIGALLDSLPRSLYAAVIVADNGSTDRTSEIARLHGAQVVTEPERGYGAACQRAIETLSDDIDTVVFMQADATENPADAASLLAPIYDGRADLVLGSRVLGRAEAGALLPHQAFGNWLATRLIRVLFKHRYTDLGPYRAVRVDALRRLDMRDRNFGWTVEMQVKALRHGLRVTEMPISYGKRRAGKNKVSGDWRASAFAGFKIIWTVLRLRFAPG